MDNKPFFLTFVVLALCTQRICAIPYAQSVALTEFYLSTGGLKWTRNAGWIDGDYSEPCAFTGIKCSTIQKETVVTTLSLTNNNLVGSIPPYFFTNMTELVVVQLYGNPGLGGSIPAFPPQSKLAALLLYGCAFTGSLPPTIFTPLVTVIHVLQNQLTGGIPDEISGCGKLDTLIVGQNSLSIGDLGSSICSATALHQIDFTASGLTSLPSCFTSLGGLQNLNFQNNRGLSLSVENVLCQLIYLQDLYIPETGIGGTIPSCVSNWVGMKNLIIENTQMTGTIPNEIFSLRNLVSLHLALSDFSGVIPDMFDSLPYITDVFFAGRKGSTGFVDPLPKSLFQRGSIQSLTIQFTSLVGPLPDLSNMHSLAALDLSNNFKLSTPFPGELFTKVWNVPPLSKDVLRSFHFDFTPVYGTIPSTTTDFQQMNQNNGFSFTHSLITGYVPNSTFSWVRDDSSLNNLVQDCPRLLTPVMPWVAPLVGSATFNGLFINVNAITSQVQIFSMAGGDTFTAAVSDSLTHFPADVLYCGFCIAEDQENCTSTSLSSLDPITLSTIVVLGQATITGDGLVSCTTPSGVTNPTPGLGMYYKGPGYGPPYLSEIFSLSAGFFPFRFYNPKPHLAYLSPKSGRLEGCTLITAVGTGFLNAPNATLLVDNNIMTAPGTVINDTFATFVVPLANGTYNYPTTQTLEVTFLPTGSPLDQSTSTASYQFAQTCRTPLVPCMDGFTDPEQCPVTPLCRCNSAGKCNYNASTPDVWSCGCLLGFSGDACQNCAENYFGSTCNKCPCDLSHGTCDWGVKGSGSCTCNSYFIGADCTISIVGLGVCIPLGLLAVGAAIFLFRRRRISSQDEELLVNNS
jgi:hypothetical protein